MKNLLFILWLILTGVQFVQGQQNNIPGTNLVRITKNGKHGLADSKGKIILPARYDNIVLKRHVFLVTEKQKKGIVGFNGGIIVPVVYDSIAEASYSYRVMIIPPEYDRVVRQGEYYKVTLSGLSGIARLDGTMIIQPVYDNKVIGLKNNEWKKIMEIGPGIIQ